MKYMKMNPMFDESFSHYQAVPGQIRESLWNYLGWGLPPGSFVSAVLRNNFIVAMNSSDHTWDGRSFKELAKWITTKMPPESWGSDKSMDLWSKKTDEERYERMVDFRLRPNEFDILAGRAVP